MPTNLEIAPQIGDPEKLQPTGIQSDTFTGGAKPPIDHNLSNLADSLGHFNTGLQRFSRAYGADKLIRDKEAEMAQKKADSDAAHQAWSSYLSTTTRDQQMTDIQTGKVDMSANPYVGATFKKFAADMAADNVQRQYDADSKAGKIPFGVQGYNAEGDLLNRFADERKKWARYDDGTFSQHFNARLDQMRGLVTAKDQDARGRAWQQNAEDGFYNLVGKQFDIAASDPAAGAKEISDRIRQAYADTGPAIGGGDYGVATDKMDQLTLKVLKERVQDDDNPDRVGKAMAVLDAPRTGLDGKELPPLSASLKNKAAVDEIRSLGTKTIQNAQRADLKKQVLDKDTASFGRMDGSMSTIKDDSVVGPDGRPMTGMSAKQRTEAAAANYIQGIRAQNGGKVDVDKEIEACERNNVNHPTFGAQLNAAVEGLGASQIQGGQNGVAPNDALREAGELYSKMAQHNPEWAKSQVSPKTADALDAYKTLVDHGVTPDDASNRIHGMLANPDDNKKVAFNHTAVAAAAEKVVGNVGIIHGGSPGAGGTITNQSAVNQGFVQDEVAHLAQVYARTGHMTPEQALEQAAQTISDRYPKLNGAVVSDQAMSQADVPAAQDLLKDLWTKNQEVLKGQGVTRPEDMTVVGTGYGKMIVVKRDGGFLNTAKHGDPDDPTKVTGTFDPTFTTSDLRARTALLVAQKVAAQSESLRQQWLGSSQGQKSRPDVPTDPADQSEALGKVGLSPNQLTGTL